MKRLFSLTLALVMVLTLSACGQSAATQSVDEQIDAIGEVTLEDSEAIQTAQNMLNALSSEDAATVNGAPGPLAAALRLFPLFLIYIRHLNLYSPS